MDSLNHKTFKQGVYFEGGISPQISQFVASVNFEYDHHICYFELTGKLQLNCKFVYPSLKKASGNSISFDDSSADISPS